MAALAGLAALCAPAAHAAPGLGDEVYGATLEKGEIEAEARFGRLTSGPDNGEDALSFEFAYSPSERFRIAALIETEREVGGGRKATEFAVEAIVPFGRVGGVDVAGYFEYGVGNGEPDFLESKLLLQRRAGRFDGRLNVIVEKPLQHGAPVEISYAASADMAVAGEFRLGAAAFGELGTFRHFAPRAEHFLGPVVKTEIEHIGHGDAELKLELGYLFALGEARKDTHGQVRLLAELEF